MKIHQVVQNSAQWHRLRAGIPTASEFKKIITPAKAELSKSHTAYMCHLLAEYIMGRPITGPETDAMAHGTAMEEPAAKMFTFVTGLEVEPVGFVTTDDLMIGASPDRKVCDQNAGVEIKSPLNEGHHVQYLIAKGIEDEHRPQVQGQMFVCEYDTVYTVSYHREMPLAVSAICREEAYIAKMKDALGAFVDLLLAKRLELDQRYGPFLRPEPEQQAEAIGSLGVTMEDVDILWEHTQKGAR